MPNAHRTVFSKPHRIALKTKGLTRGAGFAQDTHVILLVDDNDALRQGLATLLRDRGCDVIEASSGEQARRLAFGCSNLQLLITDIALSPSDSGAQLAASIRHRNPHISALLMSAHPDDVLLRYGVSLDDTMWVLRKPFTAQEFMQRVALLLSIPSERPAQTA
jgi:two-component system OmpR family response regulator